MAPSDEGEARVPRDNSNNQYSLVDNNEDYDNNDIAEELIRESRGVHPQRPDEEAGDLGLRSDQLRRAAAMEVDYDSDQERAKRRQQLCCYTLGVLLLMTTPYSECEDKIQHYITLKTWVIVLQFISFMQYGKESIGRKLNRRLEHGEITYQTKQRIKMALTVACELFHSIW